MPTEWDELFPTPMNKKAPKQSKRLLINFIVQKQEKDDQITYKLLDVS